jgi:CheY-like chemotaxis protein
VFLDGAGSAGYGTSWATAAWLHQRQPPVPTIMLTGHVEEASEAVRRASVRSQLAAFAGVLVKPFELDQLLTAVERAIAPVAQAVGQ